MELQKELEKSLADWIANFAESDGLKVVSSSLVNHQTSDIWKYLIRHVRPREETWKIKANLEIKNGSISQKKLELKKAIENRKKEIAQLEKNNAALAAQIRTAQQKIIVKDTNSNAVKAKHLAFSRDVTFVKTHRSECAARAREVENLRDCLATVQRNILPVPEETDETTSLTDKVLDITEEYRRFLEPELSDADKNAAWEKLANVLQSHPHSSVAEVLKSLSKEQLQNTELYRRTLRERIQSQSPAENLKAYERDMYDLSTKIVSLWSLVRELKENVVPTAKLRRDSLRQELVRVMQDRLVLDEDVCRDYVDVGKDLAAKRGILEYLRSEIVHGQTINKNDVEGIEELCDKAVRKNAEVAVAGKQLFHLLHMVSSLHENILHAKPLVPKMPELSSPTELRDSLVKEVESTLAAFSRLDSREDAKRRRSVIKFSLPVFEVLTQKKVTEYLLQRRSFQEFIRTTRLSFEAKRAVLAKQEEKADAVKGVLKKVSAHREEFSSALLPRLKTQLEKMENEKKTLQRCHVAIDNWIHEPGQNAILPHRVIDDATFQEWKSKTPALNYQPSL